MTTKAELLKDALERSIRLYEDQLSMFIATSDDEYLTLEVRNYIKGQAKETANNIELLREMRDDV